METNKKTRKVTVIEESKQWKLHQSFGQFVGSLNRLPDARSVQTNPLRSAPAERTVMVF